MRVTVETYGEGGFDPAKPNGNLIESYEVDAPEPTAEERLDALAERLEKATTLAEVRAAAREAKRREPPAPVEPPDREPPTGPDRRP